MMFTIHKQAQMNPIEKMGRTLLCALLAFTIGGPINAQEDWRYTVRPQDTISGVASQHLKSDIPWPLLARYNQLVNPNSIQPGQQLRIPYKWLSMKQSHAQLLNFSGQVRIQVTEASWRNAQTGDTIQMGQSIHVGPSSSALLQFADASQLVMQPDTRVTMDTLSTYAEGFMVDTQLRLQSGRVEVHANPQARKGQKFQVVTPAAVASVRGTQFLVEVQQLQTVQQTMTGQVEFQTAQGSVLVPQGFGSAVKPGEKPSEPEKVKPAPVFFQPKSKVTDFPITLHWQEQKDVQAWSVQVGRDRQMAQLLSTQVEASSNIDAGILDNGTYHLRVWSLDARGIPGQIGAHEFEVSILRTLQGPAIQLKPEYFAIDRLALQLQPLPPPQKYLLQVTKDAEGKQPVWHQLNPSTALTVPAPPGFTEPHFLWIWVY
jgi:hypothetical protein